MSTRHEYASHFIYAAEAAGRTAMGGSEPQFGARLSMRLPGAAGRGRLGAVIWTNEAFVVMRTIQGRAALWSVFYKQQPASSRRMPCALPVLRAVAVIHRGRRCRI